MTILDIERVAGARLALALAAVPAVVLARRAGRAYADVPVALVAPLVRSLAFAGIRAEACAADLFPPPDSFVARADTLTPLEAGDVDLDVVRVERVPLGSATREVLRRRVAGLLPPTASDRARCRDLLRGADALFAWSRLAWGSRSALRSQRSRRILRPIVFDRAAIARLELRGRATARGDEIGRWLFA